MSRFRYREDDSSTTTTVIGVLAGTIAGFALGVFVADRMGGIGGMTDRIRRVRGFRRPHGEIATESIEEFDDY